MIRTEKADLGAVGGGAVAGGFALAGGVRGLTAHEAGRREHAARAARGVLVAAQRTLVTLQLSLAPFIYQDTQVISDGDLSV